MMTPDNMCRLSGVVIMRNNRWIMAVGLLSLWVAPSYGDALRCNNQVVREGDSKAEVLAACGQPVLKESNCGVGGKNKKGACRRVEAWVYQVRRGALTTYLQFERGKLVAIDYGKRVQ